MSNSITDFGSNQYWYTEYLICWYEVFRQSPRSESELLELEQVRQQITKSWWSSLSNEWGVRLEIVRPAPPPEYMIQQESHRGRLIETSSKIPTSTRNPADKVHYIVHFRDWRLTHSVTLALDVPKMGTIGSGELENRQTPVGIPAFLLFSGPIRKRIQYLLVVNRTNHLHGYLCFGTKQLELGSVNRNMYYPYGRSSNWEDPSTWDEEKGLSIFFSYSVKPMIRYWSR